MYVYLIGIQMHHLMDKVPLMVHMYNPFIANEDIRAFLGRYCSLVSADQEKEIPCQTEGGLIVGWGPGGSAQLSPIGHLWASTGCWGSRDG